MIDVKMRPLGALEENVLSCPVGFVKEVGNVPCERRKPLAIGKVFVFNGCRDPAVFLEKVLQEKVLFLQIVVELLAEVLAVEQVVQANAAAADLVLIARADATSRGADLGLALSAFPWPRPGLGDRA